MSNTIPMQIYDLNGKIQVEYAEDTKKSREEITEQLQKELGDSFCEINFRKGQKIVTGSFQNGDHKNIYFVVANITFMGGTEGQHPKDLKRIQYTVDWRDFYNEYSPKGKILWLGLYSYKGINIWAYFEPESYLVKHVNSEMISKGGHKARYSCHIFLNDLYQGYENKIYKKIDKNKNTVGAVRPGCLVTLFNNMKQPKNPIIEMVDSINRDIIEWNKWIVANRAITYMKGLKEITGFKMWKQNLWNGWYIEALYSEYLYKHPSIYMDYVATSKNVGVKNEYNKIGLDLAFPNEKQHFIGDLKAICEGTGNTPLNDETKVKKALEKYKKIWFVIYIHRKKQGKTNDYEMVRWRNQYILDQGEWDYKEHPEFDPLSAPNTPHSVEFYEMVIIELNEITKNKYFSILPQWGQNSDGKERHDKFYVSKKMLDGITDDGFVIYRYRPSDKLT